MADTLHLQIATPERLLVDEEVARVEVPGRDGYLGILPEHAPLLGILGSGVISYSGSGGDRILAVSGGFLEVIDNQVRVLAEEAEFSNEINVEQARQKLTDAQAALEKPADEAETDRALEAARAAQARIDASERGH